MNIKGLNQAKSITTPSLSLCSPRRSQHQRGHGQQPWEPTCVLANFPHAVSCGDSWSNSANLVIGTEHDGTFLVASNRPPVSESECWAVGCVTSAWA